MARYKNRGPVVTDVRFVPPLRDSFASSGPRNVRFSRHAAHVSFCALVFRSKVPECAGPAMGTDCVEVLCLPRCRGVSWVKQVTHELFWETYRCESTRVLR